MKVIAEKGQRIALVLKAAPFIPKMNQAEGRIDNELNTVSGTYRGQCEDDSGAFLFFTTLAAGGGCEWRVDHDAVLMYGIRTNVDIARPQ